MLQSLQDPSKLQMLLNTSSGGGGAAAAGGGGGTDGGMGVIGPPVPSAPPPTASTPVGTVMGNDVQNALAALVCVGAVCVVGGWAGGKHARVMKPCDLCCLLVVLFARHR